MELFGSLELTLWRFSRTKTISTKSHKELCISAGLVKTSQRAYRELQEVAAAVNHLQDVARIAVVLVTGYMLEDLPQPVKQ